jgi:hypothetical protein
MVLSMCFSRRETDALDAAKEVLNDGGYGYYYIKSGELVDNDSKWLLRFFALVGTVSVFVDSDTGKVLKVSLEDEQHQRR